MGFNRLYEYEVECDQCHCKSIYKDTNPDIKIYNYKAFDTTNSGLNKKYFVVHHAFNSNYQMVLCSNCFTKLYNSNSPLIEYINNNCKIKLIPVYFKESESCTDSPIKYRWFIDGGINNIDIESKILYNPVKRVIETYINESHIESKDIKLNNFADIILFLKTLN